MPWMQRKKTQLLKQYGFWKSRNTSVNNHFFCNFGPNDIFWRLCRIVSETILCKSYGVLGCVQCIMALLLRYKNQLLGNFFFIRGDPNDFGGLEIQCLARSKIENKNGFGICRSSVTIIKLVQHSMPYVTQMRLHFLCHIFLITSDHSQGGILKVQPSMSHV